MLTKGFQCFAICPADIRWGWINSDFWNKRRRGKSSITTTNYLCLYLHAFSTSSLDKNWVHSCCVLAVQATLTNSNKIKWEFNSSCIIKINELLCAKHPGITRANLGSEPESNWIHKIKKLLDISKMTGDFSDLEFATKAKKKLIIHVQHIYNISCTQVWGSSKLPRCS